MENITFSIIIPTFNSSLTLRFCLKSLIIQEYTHFEVLIIDGNSSDNTYDIVKEFKDKRINYYSEPDKGVYDAMNKGISLAKGKWLYFLGSDDEFYDKNILTNVSKFIEINKDINVVYGNVEFKKNRPVWSKNSSIYDGEFNIDKLKSKNICHQSIFYNRNFILKNNLKYLLRYPICADWDFNLNLWFLTEFKYLDFTIAYFAADGISSTLIYDPFFLEKKMKIALYTKKYLLYIYYWIENKLIR